MITSATDNAIEGTIESAGKQATDDVDVALDALVRAVEENATDERLLVGRIHRARRERAEGKTWRVILESEPDPGMLEVLGMVSKRLSGAGGSLRRSLAVALRGEGTTISTVGRIFGVSHQRISKLLTHRVPGNDSDNDSDSDNGAGPGAEESGAEAF